MFVVIALALSKGWKNGQKVESKDWPGLGVLFQNFNKKCMISNYWENGFKCLPILNIIYVVLWSTTDHLPGTHLKLYIMILKCTSSILYCSPGYVPNAATAEVFIGNLLMQPHISSYTRK